jgi:hypothetical protein
LGIQPTVQILLIWMPGIGAEGLYLVLNQPLGRVLQALLMLSNTDRAKARIAVMIINHHLREEVRLARAATAICALVSGGLKQRDKNLSRWNVEH